MELFPKLGKKQSKSDIELFPKLGKSTENENDKIETSENTLFPKLGKNKKPLRRLFPKLG